MRKRSTRLDPYTHTLLFEHKENENMRMKTIHYFSHVISAIPLLALSYFKRFVFRGIQGEIIILLMIKTKNVMIDKNY